MNNLTNACDINKDNFPVVFKDNMLTIISVYIEHKEWCDRLVDKSEDGF